jgi:hypothetical protein
MTDLGVNYRNGQPLTRVNQTAGLQRGEYHFAEETGRYWFSDEDVGCEVVIYVSSDGHVQRQPLMVGADVQ